MAATTLASVTSHGKNASGTLYVHICLGRRLGQVGYKRSGYIDQERYQQERGSKDQPRSTTCTGIRQAPAELNLRVSTSQPAEEPQHENGVAQATEDPDQVSDPLVLSVSAWQPHYCCGTPERQ